MKFQKKKMTILLILPKISIDKIYYLSIIIKDADMAELADALDLESSS